MKKNGFPVNNSGRNSFKACAVCFLFFYFSLAGLASAGLRGFDDGDKWYLSFGMGYQYIDENFTAVQDGDDQLMEVDNNVYPVFRFGWMYTDNIVLEGGLRYDIYSGKIRGSYVEDIGDNFTSICLMAGPVYRFDTYEIDRFGEFRPFITGAVGYRFLNMDLNYPVEDFGSSFGFELAGGITKGPFEVRLGYSDYRYSKDGTIPEFDSDGSSSRLRNTGFFIEFSYLISFEEKKAAMPLKIPVAEPEPEPDDFEEVKSSEEITEIFKTVDETTNISEELFMKIEFDFDSDVIKSVSFPSLNELGMALLNFDSTENTLLIYGHADSDGPSKYNLALSERRAASVKKYIKSNFQLKHLDIQTKGFGEFQPLLPNTSEYNKMKNRRVEVMMKYHNNPAPEEGVEIP